MLRFMCLLLGLTAAAPVAAADAAYDPVPIHAETAADLVATVLGKYSVGTTYVARHTGRLTRNGAPHCAYRRVWEHTVLRVVGDAFTVRDRMSDNVNPDCEMRETRVAVDTYTPAGWQAFLDRTRAQFAARAIGFYVDKDADVFGWSVNGDAIRYAEVASWQEFMDRFLLMLRRTGRLEAGGVVFEWTVEAASYSIRP